MRSISCLTPLIPVHGIKPRIVFLLPSSSGDANVFDRRLRPPHTFTFALASRAVKTQDVPRRSARSPQDRGRIRVPTSGCRKGAQGPPDPYPQRFGPARYTPPFASHHWRAACCEGPDSVHAPFAYSPPAREQVAAEPAQAATQRMVTPRAAPIPVAARAHCLSTGRCRSLTLTVLAAFAPEASAPPKSRCHSAH